MAKKQPIKKHRRLRKYGSTFNDVDFNEPSSPSEVKKPKEEKPKDTTPYYLMQWTLGWNESNPIRFTKEGKKICSYKNKIIVSPLNSLQYILQDLQDLGYMELVSDNEGIKTYKVTPVGISKLEEKFDVLVINCASDFRKKQEYNNKLLTKKENKVALSTTNKPKRGRPKKK